MNADEWSPVIEILGDIAITCARQGFSPRETGNFVYSLKEELLETLANEPKGDYSAFYCELN